MPKLKEKKQPFEAVARLIKGYGLTGYALADVMYCSEYTARERLRHPERLTLEELGFICKNGHIPADEIREAIKFS